ncbi:hypothetical protein LXL04_024841 [Taraxacum kok-saghyz]
MLILFIINTHTTTLLLCIVFPATFSGKCYIRQYTAASTVVPWEQTANLFKRIVSNTRLSDTRLLLTFILQIIKSFQNLQQINQQILQATTCTDVRRAENIACDGEKTCSETRAIYYRAASTVVPWEHTANLFNGIVSNTSLNDTRLLLTFVLQIINSFQNLNQISQQILQATTRTDVRRDKNIAGDGAKTCSETRAIYEPPLYFSIPFYLHANFLFIKNTHKTTLLICIVFPATFSGKCYIRQYPAVSTVVPWKQTANLYKGIVSNTSLSDTKLLLTFVLQIINSFQNLQQINQQILQATTRTGVRRDGNIAGGGEKTCSETRAIYCYIRQYRAASTVVPWEHTANLFKRIVTNTSLNYKHFSEFTTNKPIDIARDNSYGCEARRKYCRRRREDVL